MTNQSQQTDALQQFSAKIIDIANTQEGSALKCIHLVSVQGQATQATFVAIEQRIVADQDVNAAYHLALMAQTTPDIPVDVKQLIEMVIKNGDNNKRLSLLKKMPVPPVEMIKAHILASNDDNAIGLMDAYLQIYPDGVGSDLTTASGQQDQIVPISEVK